MIVAVKCEFALVERGNVGFVAGRHLSEHQTCQFIDFLADIADVTLLTNQDGNKWNKHCISQSS